MRLTLTVSVLTLSIASLALAPQAVAQHSHDGDHDHDHGHAHEAAQQHGHDHGGDAHAHYAAHADRAHDHGEEGHAGGHSQHGTVAAARGGLTLEPVTALEAGAPVTVRLALSDAAGKPLTANDLAENHDHKLHVMIVDEGLDDYMHSHPAADEHGTYSLTFTPKADRTYRIWADYYVADGEASAERDHHDAPVGTPTLASASLPIGEGDAPALPETETLFVDAGEIRFRLLADDEVKAGEPVRMRVSVTDAEGMPFRGLQPIMGAFAHLVGFDPGATAMAHAHPIGAHPHGAGSRGGPDLAFDVTLEKPGPHRLFLQTMKDGEEVGAVFTVIAQP